MNGMAAAMARHRHDCIRGECERIVHCLGAFPMSSQRAVSAVAKRLLLNAPYFFNGESFDIKTKSLGAGVYLITCVAIQEER